MSRDDSTTNVSFDTASESGAAVATPSLPPRHKHQPKHSPPKMLPQWHVVLLDDDDHTYEYVINMLGGVFGYSTTRAFMLAEEVDALGRVIVFTGHRELAELKREQVIAYGVDARISTCRGGMGAVLEPAE